MAQVNAPGVKGYEVIRGGQKVSTQTLQKDDIVTKTIVSSPKKENTSRISGVGGGGYISAMPESPTGYVDRSGQPVSVSPQAAQQIDQQAKQKALEQDRQQSTVSAYKPQSLSERLKSIPSYVATNIKQDLPKTVIGVGQKIIGDRRTIGQVKEQTELKRSQEIISTGTADITNVKQDLKPYQSRGTISTEFASFNARPLNEQELLSKAVMGEISEKAAVQEVSTRISNKAQEKLNKEFETYVKPEINIIENQAQSQAEQIKADISQRTDLTIDQKNELLNQKVEELNAQKNQKVQQLVTQFNESRGQEVQKEAQNQVSRFSQKLTLAKNIKLGAESAVIGAAVAPVLGAVLPATGTASKAVQVGSKVIGAAATAYTGSVVGSGIYADYKSGDLTALSITSRISNAAPLIGFYAGAKVSNRLLNPKVDSGQLKTAVETADTKIVKDTAITKEADLAKLELTNEGRLQVTSQFQSGYSIRKAEYTIYNKNNYLNKVLKKGLPTRNIEFIETIDSQGNVINRLATGKIKLGGGRYIYNEDILQQSVGVRDDLGNIKMETTTISQTGGKKGPITEIRTSELIKPRVQYYQDETGQISRVVSSKTAVFQEDTSIPKAISKSAEYQKLEGIERNIINLNLESDSIKRSSSFIEQDVTFKTVQGAGISKRAVKPIEFSKISKPMDIGGEQVQITQTQQTVIPKTDFSNQIKINLKSASQNIKDINIPTGAFAGTGLYERTQTPEQELMSIRTSNRPLEVTKVKEPFIGTNVKTVIDKNKLKDLTKTRQIDIEINNLRDRIKSLDQTGDLGISSEIQIDRLNAGIKDIDTVKLEEPQIQEQIMPLVPPAAYPGYNLPPNTVTRLDLPPLGLWGSLPQGFKPKNFPRRIREIRKPKYSASLAAAAFQVKPTKVTQKQYEQLSKGTYSGLETRPVLEIVSDKEMKKQIKKLKF